MIGSKGKDIALYIFSVSALMVITGRLLGFPVMLFFYLNIVAAIISLYYFYYQSKARKFSKKIGFKFIVLLRVYPWWAKTLIKISGGKIKGRFNRAFEVHINTPPGLSLQQYMDAIATDLKLARDRLPESLFFWETTAPVPSLIRKLIRDESKEGNAFWKEGGWPIPRFPTKSSMKKGALRHGAFVNRG